MSTLSQGSTVLYLMLGIIAALLYWINNLRKAQPDKEPGVLFNEALERYNISVYVAFSFFFNLAEAAFAADIITTSGAEYQMSPGVRFFGHFMIAAASIVGAVSLGREIRTFPEILDAKLWKKGSYANAVKLTLLKFLAIGYSFAFAVLLPYFNMLLIANGLHKGAALRLWRASLFSSPGEYSILLQNSVDGDWSAYDPWDGLGYPMASTVVITVIHLMILGWDVIMIARGEGLPKKKDDKGDKKDDKAASGQSDDKGSQKNDSSDTASGKKGSFEDTALDLMVFCGLDEGDARVRLNTVSSVMAGIQSDSIRIGIAEKQTELGVAVNTLKKNLESKSITQSEFDSKKKDLVKKIHDYFQASPSKGDGLGMSLPKKSKN